MFLTPFSPAAHAAPPLALLMPVPIAPAAAPVSHATPAVADDAAQAMLPTIATAAGLEQQALRDGYAPGFPPALPEQARRIDLGTVRRMRCPACHSRKMTASPFHKMTRPGGYRIVAGCAVCGAGGGRVTTMSTQLQPLPAVAAKPLTDSWLDADTLAVRLCLSRRSVFRLVQIGQLPPPVKLSRKICRWRWQDVVNHLETLRRRQQQEQQQQEQRQLDIAGGAAVAVA